MKRVGEHRTAVATRRLTASGTRPPSSPGASTWLGRVAALTVAGAIGFATQADAAVFWSDYDYGYSQQPMPMAPPRMQKPHKRSARKIEAPEKQAAKPQGPLIIAISINRQNLRIYDANGFFAETPISTGMRGHATPMGVFSVIQKQKYHRSNIYSGAPMPYMERITWSGIAMHAGVLPGYPASHGCIRMPMAFAVKMYGWTRMGARVVVTPGEMTPASFSHPLLATQKVAPEPMAAAEPKADTADADTAKADTAKADTAAKSDSTSVSGLSSNAASTTATDLELRSSVGHGDGLPATMHSPAAPAPLSEQTHTADAGTLSATKATVTMSDATAPASEGASKDGATAVDTANPREKASENLNAAPDAPADITDAKKDQRRLSDTDAAPTAKPDPAVAAATKRGGPISVFISRKDAKLYVRQNFAPLFAVPVTIAPSDRPLGTHIFAAEADKSDPNVLRWSVISLPTPTRNAERRDEEERSSRRRKLVGAVEVTPAPEPDSPTEALDRLTIPADAMARITDALSTGGSIIVSDQGIAAGETGEGTDFIVSLR